MYWGRGELCGGGLSRKGNLNLCVWRAECCCKQGIRKASLRHLNKDLREGTMGLFGGTAFQAREQPVRGPEETTLDVFKKLDLSKRRGQE